MVVYSRSDVAAIAISPAHGGCGVTHSRPAPGGNPIPVWALNCSRCEDHLRHDPLWGPTQGSIPETPDEVTARESAENRTQREQLTNNVSALTAIGEALVRLAEGQQGQRTDSATLAQILAHLTGAMVPAADADAASTPPHVDPAPQPLTDAQRVELDSALNAIADDPAWDHTFIVRGGVAELPDDLDKLDTWGLPALNTVAGTLGLPGRRSKADAINAIRSHLNR